MAGDACRVAFAPTSEHRTSLFTLRRHQSATELALHLSGVFWICLAPAFSPSLPADCPATGARPSSASASALAPVSVSTPRDSSLSSSHRHSFHLVHPCFPSPFETLSPRTFSVGKRVEKIVRRRAERRTAGLQVRRLCVNNSLSWLSLASSPPSPLSNSDTRSYLGCTLPPSLSDCNCSPPLPLLAPDALDSETASRAFLSLSPCHHPQHHDAPFLFSHSSSSCYCWHQTPTAPPLPLPLPPRPNSHEHEHHADDPSSSLPLDCAKKAAPVQLSSPAPMPNCDLRD